MSEKLTFTDLFIFFFQAEDGIRDKLVTGVQTCALPIWSDESGDVVDDRPRAGLTANVPGDAVRTGLERHHVHAFRRAVGDRGSLSGLEVEIGRASCRERV